MFTYSYIIYIILSISIIIWVGHSCYKHGKTYIVSVLPNTIALANKINKLLRLAYYLLNIGLSIWNLNHLKHINTITESIIEICNKLAFILLTIGIFHIINIYTIYIMYSLKTKTS